MVTLVRQKAHPIHSSRVKLSMLESGRVLACYNCSKFCFRNSHFLLYCPWCEDPIGTGWLDEPDGRSTWSEDIDHSSNMEESESVDGFGGSSNSEEWKTVNGCGG